MSDSILQKFTSKTAVAEVEAAGRTEIEEVENFGVFGWLRDSRARALMLELRKKDGNILAVGYGWLEKVAFNPSEGIKLFVVGQQIRIDGRNLNADLCPMVRLFQGIIQHRVAWIQEAAKPAVVQAGNLLVDTILW